MQRKEFLGKVRQIAFQQITDSSFLSEKEFKHIMESDDTEEVASYRMAKNILEDASYDMENTLAEVIEFNS